MSAIGKSGARSSGPIGWPVPGCSGGDGGTGRSAAMLYQARGIRDSSRTNFVCRGSDGAIALSCTRPDGMAVAEAGDASLARRTGRAQPAMARTSCSPGDGPATWG